MKKNAPIKHRFSNMQPMLMLGLVVLATALLPNLALAMPDFAGSDQKVCGFFDNVNGLLNMASIAVVTIAIVFSGYQIAFAHKRISDVAPILIGGVLIGAAAQIAKMVVGDTGQQCGTAMIVQLLNHYA
ncbi:TrbC/VirB2 family protein [Dyella sp.]|uniref:TrbC/VirB2 family protein n=1 Tax=Dyella sp. TaxID=1869338 RepID=UPI0039C8AA4F